MKKFHELYESGKDFYQLHYYNRCEEYSGDRIFKSFETDEEAKSEIVKMEKENEKLFKMMLEVYKDYGVTEENYVDWNKWNTMIDKVNFDALTKIEKHLFRYEKNRVGFTHISLSKRNKEREEKEEEEYWKEREASGQEDNGPYGGAFASEMDFINWKDGPGFLSN